MSNCTCCDPPWSWVKPIPDPYTFMKVNASTGELVFLGDHGNNTLDIDCDGTYIYLCGGASAIGNYKVRKIRASNGEFIWAVQNSIATSICTVASYGVLVGGTGVTGSYVHVGTGSGTSSSGGGLPTGKDINLLDLTTGAVIWNAYLNPDGITPGTVTGIAVDPSGNIYAVGSIPATTIIGAATTKGCISKYDSSGNMLWSRNTQTASGAAVFSNVATDGTYVSVTSSTAEVTNPHVLRQYDPSGNLLWSYGGTSLPTSLSGVALLASSDSVTIGGSSIGVGSRYDIVSPFGSGAGTGSFGASGMTIETVTWSAPGSTNQFTGKGICIDSSDGIYVVTSSPSSLATSDYTIYKFANTGTGGNIVWQRRYFIIGNNASFFAPTKCAVIDGFLYVCGQRVVL